MVSSTWATTADEEPVFLDVDGEQIFAITVNPTAPPNGGALVCVQGGLWTPSPGKGRMSVEMGRRFAADGFRSVRFDFRGVGESTGETEVFKVDEPLSDDVVAAAEHLRARGATDLVMIGTCYGGRTVLAAGENIDWLRGLAMFAPPVRDFEVYNQITSKPLSWWVRKAARWRVARALFDKERRQTYVNLVRRKFIRWKRRRREGVTEQRPPAAAEGASPLFLNQLAAVLERGVRVLFVFGEDDECYAEFKQAKSGRLGRVLDRAGELVTLIEVPGKVHGLTSTLVQRQVMEATAAWLPTVVPVGASSTPS